MKRFWLALLVVTLLLPASAVAQTVDLSDAPVIRRPLEWRKGRFGLSPVIGVTLNDPYWTQMLVGASADYHILDWLAVGVDFRYAIGFSSALLDQIESELAQARGRGELSGEVDVVTTSRVNFLTTANVQMIPIYGKFILFESFEVAYDLHFLAGVGYARTLAYPRDDATRQIANRGGNSVVPVVGAGLRLFLNRWLALNFEFRDYFVNMVRVVPEYPTRRSTPGKSFEHNLVLSVGVSFMLPAEIGHGH